MTLSSSVHRPNRRVPLLCGAWLALGVGLAGCPGEPDGPERRFEVGTGRLFTPLEEGDTVELVSGVQGGQHVFVSMRAWELGNIRARVEMSMERASDGERVSSPYSVDLRFTHSFEEGGPSTIEGLLLMIPTPSKGVNQQVRLTASFESEAGEHGTDTRTVNLQWAGEPPQP
ncbi:hypothetical protein ACLESD_14020 [Pyxidicoccus sp. 3LFB2]